MTDSSVQFINDTSIEIHDTYYAVSNTIVLLPVVYCKLNIVWTNGLKKVSDYYLY